FQYKNTAHDKQDDFMANNNGNHTQGRAQGQGSYIAHKNLCGIGVEPEKAQASTHQCTTKDNQFTSTCDVGDLQVLGKLNVTGKICDDAQRGRNHDRGHDRQTIKTGSQIHGVA